MSLVLALSSFHTLLSKLQQILETLLGRREVGNEIRIREYCLNWTHYGRLVTLPWLLLPHRRPPLPAVLAPKQ